MTQDCQSPSHVDGCADLAESERVIGIYFDPPMAIARVGAAKEPLDAYTWALDTHAHQGVQTRIVPAPTLRPVPVPKRGHKVNRLSVDFPNEISFKDHKGRIRPVAPFFELWARVQDVATGQIRAVPVSKSTLSQRKGSLGDLHFEVIAANRKAEARTKLASCAAVARIEFNGHHHGRRALDAISPHTEDQVQMVRPDAPLPLGHIEYFAPDDEARDCRWRLDQVRLRFTPGKGDTFGPPNAIEAPASPLAPGDFGPPITEYGNIHKMTKPENRILSQDTAWSGYNFRTGNTPKWPTPMDSYDGARVGSGNGWGLIDDTCDLVITATLTLGGRLFTAKARSFAGPPDFAPDKRPFYSIQDELEDRDLPPAVLDGETPDVILDLFRRIFETSSLLNLDQRRTWALTGNAGELGANNPDDPDWDDGLSPRLGPRSMRESDAPYADLTPYYTPGQGDTRKTVSGPADRLPYTQVVQQIHARMADSPVLRDFLARRPDRMRALVRPPFARLADLPRRNGVGKPAKVAMASDPETGPVHYRDPRSTMDQTYDMRMPPFMRHSMGYPLAITRRQYDLLMAYIDQLEAEGRADEADAKTKAGDRHD